MVGYVYYSDYLSNKNEGLVQTLYNLFTSASSFSLPINTRDVIIAQPFRYVLVLASFILRHECDNYV